jgi:hypothetical protein
MTARRWPCATAVIPILAGPSGNQVDEGRIQRARKCLLKVRKRLVEAKRPSCPFALCHQTGPKPSDPQEAEPEPDPEVEFMSRLLSPKPGHI